MNRRDFQALTLVGPTRDPHCSFFGSLNKFVKLNFSGQVNLKATKEVEVVKQIMFGPFSEKISKKAQTQREDPLRAQDSRRFRDLKGSEMKTRSRSGQKEMR